jgi:hypothetical protein
MLLSKELARLEWQYMNVPALFEFTLYESACRLSYVYFYSVKMRQVND